MKETTTITLEEAIDIFQSGQCHAFADIALNLIRSRFPEQNEQYNIGVLRAKIDIIEKPWDENDDDDAHRRHHLDYLPHVFVYNAHTDTMIDSEGIRAASRYAMEWKYTEEANEAHDYESYDVETEVMEYALTLDDETMSHLIVNEGYDSPDYNLAQTWVKKILEHHGII